VSRKSIGYRVKRYAEAIGAELVEDSYVDNDEEADYDGNEEMFE